MAIDYKKLKNREFGEVEHTYTSRDTMLYALGVGVGSDPLNRSALRFVYEDGLQALPTMGAVLAHPGFWLKEPDTGVDWTKVLHADQEIVLHHPLPVEGTVKATTKIDEIIDKGKGKGAFIYSSRQVSTDDGEPLCTLRQTTMLREQGGFNGPNIKPPPYQPIPAADPHWTCTMSTLPQAALIYRLSGDYNPLHADPDVAESAGFKQPILHGLCTFGVAGYAILSSCCDFNASRLHSIRARFSAPVIPGEAILTQIWRLDSSSVAFRCLVVGRDQVVLDNGYAKLS